MSEGQSYRVCSCDGIFLECVYYPVGLCVCQVFDPTRDLRGALKLLQVVICEVIVDLTVILADHADYFSTSLV